MFLHWVALTDAPAPLGLHLHALASPAGYGILPLKTDTEERLLQNCVPSNAEGVNALWALPTAAAGAQELFCELTIVAQCDENLATDHFMPITEDRELPAANINLQHLSIGEMTTISMVNLKLFATFYIATLILQFLQNRLSYPPRA